MAEHKHRGGAIAAGILLGFGMGGFVDGIVLHQILQWHNMVSNWIPPTTVAAMGLNMTWDGYFHAFDWLVTLAGIFLLWKAAYRREPIPNFQAFAGQFVLGWGLFNLIEGIVDHQILRIHYVRQVANYPIYNLAFLAIGGGLFILVGWLLMRGGKPVLEEV